MRRWREEDYWPTFGGEDFGGMGGPVNWMHPGEAGPHAGVGPRNYQRPDESILEDVMERLTRNSMLDATNIEVRVHDGEVTLTGTVDSRQMKRLADYEVNSVAGVKDVHNQIRLKSLRHAA
jgi:osmotically-inducible protein OsmY